MYCIACSGLTIPSLLQLINKLDEINMLDASCSNSLQQACKCQDEFIRLAASGQQVESNLMISSSCTKSEAFLAV